jgi:hypothetical protein
MADITVVGEDEHTPSLLKGSFTWTLVLKQEIV